LNLVEGLVFDGLGHRSCSSDPRPRLHNGGPRLIARGLLSRPLAPKAICKHAAARNAGMTFLHCKNTFRSMTITNDGWCAVLERAGITNLGSTTRRFAHPIAHESIFEGKGEV
jgi:hypothetical protein